MKLEYEVALNLAKALDVQLKSLLSPTETNVPSMEHIITWITYHGNLA